MNKCKTDTADTRHIHNQEHGDEQIHEHIQQIQCRKQNRYMKKRPLYQYDEKPERDEKLEQWIKSLGESYNEKLVLFQRL